MGGVLNCDSFSNLTVSAANGVIAFDDTTWNRTTVDTINLIATKRGSTVYFNVYSFLPKNEEFLLRRRSAFTGIKKSDFSISIVQENVILKNKEEKVEYVWDPFE